MIFNESYLVITIRNSLNSKKMPARSGPTRLQTQDCDSLDTEINPLKGLCLYQKNGGINDKLGKTLSRLNPTQHNGTSAHR